ncbi:MAG: SanA protein [Ruminococcaceae bacterium]|nr:SanA protein [Oscillospiraceae bacterium]
MKNKSLLPEKKINIKIRMVLFCVISCICSLLFVNGLVKNVGTSRMITVDEAAELENVDCVIVLGCQVRDDGSLSDMLHDRLSRGVEIYNILDDTKILMSGDHGRADYNEVGAMKKFAVESGVPSEDVFMDHAGFSTYETMYRAKEVFDAKKVIVVTQEYHLSRALYIAEELGLEAYGVDSDLRGYMGQTRRDVREVLARCKDFMMTIAKPAPTYLGEVISVSGDGDLTNDKYYMRDFI